MQAIIAGTLESFNQANYEYLFEEIITSEEMNEKKQEKNAFN